MQDFFNSTLWIIISFGISVFGIFGTIFGIYKDRKSSKELQSYKYLFKIAGQHVDLEDKESIIKDYQNRIDQMQKIIKEQIPEEAKKIALKGILENELQVLSSTYTKVRSLQSELELLSSEDKSENEYLINNVNKVIEPTYSQKRSDNIFRTVFYLVSIVSSLLSITLPSVLYKTVIFIVLIIQLIIGVRTVVNALKQNYTHKEINHLMNKAMIVFSITFLCVFVLIIGLLLLFVLNTNIEINDVSFLLFSAITFLLHLFFGIAYFIEENKKHMVLWLILSLISLGFFVSFVFLIEIWFAFLSILTALADLVLLFICLFKIKRN